MKLKSESKTDPAATWARVVAFVIGCDGAAAALLVAVISASCAAAAFAAYFAALGVAAGHGLMSLMLGDDSDA